MKNRQKEGINRDSERERGGGDRTRERFKRIKSEDAWTDRQTDREGWNMMRNLTFCVVSLFKLFLIS